MANNSDKTETGLVVGVGSALVDLLLPESEEFLASSGAQKGGMTLVEADDIHALLSKAKGSPDVVPGGSACNTIVGIGRLGAPARFVGKRGTDDLGELFERDLIKNNVEPRLSISESPTGRVLSIITPDAQRSMFTFLGAAAEARPEEYTHAVFEGASIVHVEGYLLFNQQLIEAVLASAKSAGARISLDLASYTVVEASRSILDELVDEYVDILIANEDEARAFTGTDKEDEALAILARKSEIAVLKVGKRGSYVAHGGETFKIERCGTGKALDTTGAGDLWASGFLYGLVKGYSIETCGMIGSACGAEVCKVIGTEIPEEGWKRISDACKGSK